MQQVLPHPFVELLAMTYGKGSFDRAARKFTRHLGRDVQTECCREKHGQDAYAEVAQRRQLIDGALGELRVDQQ
jgi:hypothetical protein